MGTRFRKFSRKLFRKPFRNTKLFRKHALKEALKSLPSLLLLVEESESSGGVSDCSKDGYEQSLSDPAEEEEAKCTGSFEATDSSSASFCFCAVMAVIIQ